METRFAPLELGAINSRNHSMKSFANLNLLFEIESQDLFIVRSNILKPLF